MLTIHNCNYASVVSQPSTNAAVDQLTGSHIFTSGPDEQGGTDKDWQGERRIYIAQEHMEIQHVVITRLFNSNVKSAQLYGAETWISTNNCLRRILQIRWLDISAT